MEAFVLDIVWYDKSRLFPADTTRNLYSNSVYALSYPDQELVTEYHMWFFLNHAHGTSVNVTPKPK